MDTSTTTVKTAFQLGQDVEARNSQIKLDCPMERVFLTSYVTPLYKPLQFPGVV
jgi:hypothetical protein